MSQSAALRVFGTLELLEAILLQLDISTLLTCSQRVCCSWYEATRNSILIQRRLFFQPEAPNDRDTTCNPILAKIFPTWFDEFGELNNKYRGGFYHAKFARPDRKHAILYRRASWRRMLVTQQPPKVVGTWIRTNSGQSAWSITLRDDLPVGLYMGDLYDKTVHGIRRNASAFDTFLKPREVRLEPGHVPVATTKFYTFAGSESNQLEWEQVSRMFAASDFVLALWRSPWSGTGYFPEEAGFIRNFSFRGPNVQELQRLVLSLTRSKAERMCSDEKEVVPSPLLPERQQQQHQRNLRIVIRTLRKRMFEKK